MSLTNRQRGDYFERQTKAALEARGWVVNRSAGSHGEADLWAARAGNTLMFVQCKLGGRIGPAERAALIAVADKAGARAVLATRPRGGHVLLATVLRHTSHLVPLATLRVPARPGKAPVDP